MSSRMPTVRVTKQFRFEMAHALTGHDGPCKNIHGHSYRLSVTVSGKTCADASRPDNGMVIDFAQLKNIVAEHIIWEFDHSLVLCETDRAKIPLGDNRDHVIYLPFPPTCELLLVEFHSRIAKHLPVAIELVSMRLDETATSYAEWFASDNK